jgi:Dolichyl-phosphate-mannose-protein mannosyltransferase
VWEAEQRVTRGDTSPDEASGATGLLARARSVAPSLSPSAVGIGLLAVGLLIHITTLSQPLIETQEFRQTQTAWQALLFHEHGINLFQPQVPVFGPPFALPIEFPLFQAAAAIIMNLGLSPDAACRLTALICFLITAALLWRLLVRVAGEAAGLAGLTAFIFSPLGLLASRMSLIEFMATAGSLGFVYWALRWHETGRWIWYVAAIVAASVGLLVKVTTGVMYLVPVAVLILSLWRSGRLPVARRSVYCLAVVVLFGIPLSLTAAWTVYADGVRASNPASAWLSSSGGLTGVYFGSIQQRLSPSTWFTLSGEAQELLFGGAVWIWGILAACAAVLLSRRAFALSLVLAAALGPLIFTDAYLLDSPGPGYYMSAISPFAAIAIGFAAAWMWRARRQLVAAMVLVALVATWTLNMKPGYWNRQYDNAYDPQQVIPVAQYVEANSQPNELIVLAGYDWDPTIFYYARREGLMIRTQVTAADQTNLSKAGYSKLFICSGAPGSSPPCRVVNLTNP